MTVNDQKPRIELLSRPLVSQLLCFLLEQHTSGELEVRCEVLLSKFGISSEDLNQIIVDLIDAGLLDEPGDTRGTVSLSGRGMRLAQDKDCIARAAVDASQPDLSPVQAEILEKLTRAVDYLPQALKATEDLDSHDALSLAALAFFNHPASITLIQRMLVISERNNAVN